ncbi:hypothetical protein I5677_02370 [Mobilitalea sibirica]|uniref:Uncharacterized protein n=2 Tax=Mobilitalea sibirica TaxID=1462919 RepID=A0A8J7KZ99_9FIRM|nr:hypothetical protein [Mobilitalea sibirica]
MFGIMGDDYGTRAEQVLHFSKNIMQGGKPLLWTMAGALEKLRDTYNKRFLSYIYFLALTCSEEELLFRMKHGRGIHDENWLQASVGHNNYLREHDSIDGVNYDKYDISGKNVHDVATYVDTWINSKL